MRLNIRYDGKSEKFCKIFEELNKAPVQVQAGTEKEPSFSGEDAAYLAGGSALQVAANHEARAMSRALSRDQKKKMARPVAVVAPLSAADGFGEPRPPTTRNPSHTPRRPEPSNPRAATTAPRGLERSIPLLAGLGMNSVKPAVAPVRVFITAGCHSPAQQAGAGDDSKFPARAWIGS